MTRRIQSSSAEETFAIGQRFAQYLQSGVVVILTGELGAGKTTFTKGVASGLGIEKPVTSPTFVIAKSYRTKHNVDFIHIDAYRLRSIQDIRDLDVEAQIDNAIVVAEWGEGFFEMIGNLIEVKFEIDSEDSRTITMLSNDIDVESMNL